MSAEWRVAFLNFGGLRTDLAAHLLDPDAGDVSALQNLRTDTGALVTRPGIGDLQRNADLTKVPRALWSRQVTVPTTDGLHHINEALYGAAGEYAADLPDVAQLGDRLFLVDGQAGNLVVSDGGDERPMGALGQRSDFTLTASDGSGVLESGEYYTYGVMRILSKGNLELRSAVLTLGVTLGAADDTVTIGGLVEYEYAGLMGSGWSVRYVILRSDPETPTVLYQRKVYDADDFPETGEYVDAGADADLDLTVSYNTEDGVAVTFPPVRYIRAHEGRLVGAGARVRACTLDTPGEDLAEVEPTGVAVSTADLDAQLRIDGEDGYFLITEVDTTAGTWTLDRDVASALSDADAVLTHVQDTVYVSAEPLPGDVERYEVGAEVLAADGGGRITGLATASGLLYVLREHRVEVLTEVAEGQYQLTTMADCPPGCVSHATIADVAAPRVLYYAGHAGVVELLGGQARMVSDPVRAILDDEVEHDYDAYAHGVYDPTTGLYHLWLVQDGDVEGTPGSETAIIPSRMLTYDVRRERWYDGDLPATCSGLWRDDAGHLYPVVGIVGGVARLGTGDTDGADVEATAQSATSASVTLTTAALTADALIGLPVLVKHVDGSLERRCVKDNTTSGITIFGTWEQTPAEGATVLPGAIRWLVRSREVDFGQAFGARKKLTRFTVQNEVGEGVARVTFAEARGSVEQLGEVAMDQAETVLRGAQVGLRADGATWQIEGYGPQTILKVALEATEVGR